MTRIRCCVPFCRRSAPSERHPGCQEIICGKHWRLASKALRRRRSRILRRYRARFGDRAAWTFPAGSPDRIEAVRLARLDDRLWERCKAQAIERAAGI
jgi:hypothetical protein